MEPKRASALEDTCLPRRACTGSICQYITSTTNGDVYQVYTEVLHSTCRYITFARSTHTRRAGKGLERVCWSGLSRARMISWSQNQRRSCMLVVYKLRCTNGNIPTYAACARGKHVSPGALAYFICTIASMVALLQTFVHESFALKGYVRPTRCKVRVVNERRWCIPVYQVSA